MSFVQIRQTRQEASAIGTTLIRAPSVGLGQVSTLMTNWLALIQQPTPTFSGQRLVTSKTLEEQLYDSLASFKVRTASVAMHLDHDWRSRLFGQLDSLLAADDWQADDLPPSLDTFSTFLRMLMLLRPARRPGLGATSNGMLVATWTSGDDRLTIECLPQDIVRWHLSVSVQGERERAAAITPLARLSAVLQPYSPERWFADGNDLSSR